MSHSKQYISILGDSISTLAGYTPADGVFYDPNFSSNTGIRFVEDTWWMKVIQGLHGQLLVNNSYAGSTVCRNGYQPASSPWRIAKLRKGDISPDLILIYSGLNDVAFYRPPDEFADYYLEMLLQLKETYPNAAICSATLCRGYLKNPSWPPFINFNACHPLSSYNERIREAVQKASCQLADLDSFGLEYSSLDGVHPDASGMDTIAQIWLRSLL